MVTKCVTDPPSWFCDSLWKVSELREAILMSPLKHIRCEVEN